MNARTIQSNFNTVKAIVFCVVFSACFMLFHFNSFSQGGVSINTTGAAADNSTILDLSSPTQGLRIPRVALTDTALASPIVNPVHSLLVFDTVTFIGGTPGYYYWDANYTQWVRLASGAGSVGPTGSNTGDMLYWNGTTWVLVPVGQPGQFLMINALNVPAWSSTASPSVNTSAASSLTGTGATSGGNVTSDGGSTVTDRGICWSTSQNPTTADNKIVDGSGTGWFTSYITGLSIGTTYYVRAYATNITGTAYGSEISFTTITYPTLSTTWANPTTPTTATSGGDVSSNGGETLYERGICWSTNSNPTISDSRLVDCNWCGTGTFTSDITGLAESTPYYARAYATNSVGTAYGNEVSFTTPATVIPTLNTTPASPIGSYDATSGGYVFSDGGAYVSDRGICYNTTGNPTISDNKVADCYWCWQGAGSFSSALGGLTPGATYYVRSYATNWVGTGYGDEISFRTLAVLPAVSTSATTAIGATSATSGGVVSYDGGETLSERGIFLSLSPNSEITGTRMAECYWCGTGTYVNTLSGLAESTTYYVRAYAVNSAGMTIGYEETFATIASALPNVSTTATSQIAGTVVLSGGNVTNDGGLTITERGVCWGTDPDPDITANKIVSGSGTGVFSSLISGLTMGTTYHVRAFATNSLGTSYGSDESFTTSATEGIGDPFQGGVIAYIFQSGETGYIPGETHGLIAAANDQGSSTEWGCWGTVITGADGTDLGTGAQNTADIIVECTSSGIAAEICANASLNGYDDWYLPSKDELNKLYISKAVIGVFASTYYWSSSEIDGNNAWLQNFDNGYQDNTSYKTNTMYVRAVRNF